MTAMRSRLYAATIIVAAFAVPTGSAAAQQRVTGGASDSLGDLVAKGFEIKAAAPNAKKFVVWVQKGDTAYACEFVTVNRTRCEEIE